MSVMWLFLAVSLVRLQFMVLVFPDNTHFHSSSVQVHVIMIWELLLGTLVRKLDPCSVIDISTLIMPILM